MDEDSKCLIYVVPLKSRGCGDLYGNNDYSSKWKKNKKSIWISLILLAGLTLFIIIPGIQFYEKRWNSVPDIVHFYRGPEEAGNVSSVECLCLRAALSLHGSVHVHSARPRGTLRALRAMGPWPSSLRVLPAPTPEHPFTGPDASNRAARLVSLHILRIHGGIFLGNDVYLLKNLNEFRGDEMTVSLRRGQVQTQLLIAQKDARFLKDWLASYSRYRPEEEIVTSLPLDTARTLKEAIVPVFKDIFFIPEYLDTDDVLALHFIL